MLPGKRKAEFIFALRLLILYNMKTILFAGGGSMGHVMVHLAVYPLLKDSADAFSYIGGFKR